MIVDRSGGARPLSAERKAFSDVAVSPDGARLATMVTGANDNLWMLALDHGTLTRLTFDAENGSPTWSPDGTRLAFGSTRAGQTQLYVMAEDGNGMPVLQHESTRREVPNSWTRHGDMLAFVRTGDTNAEIWTIPMSGERQPRKFLPKTQFDEREPRFSPDGRWLAYASNESGRWEVYVRPFPGPGRKHKVSVDGGVFPRWAADGRELFYRRIGSGATDEDDALMVTNVKAGAELSFSPPRVLFKGRYANGWDVLPDGRHFVFIKDFAQPRTAVTIVQNWFEELSRLVPAK
jgi:eukaryotic-like serine/threonine-protein kinase